MIIVSEKTRSYIAPANIKKLLIFNGDEVSSWVSSSYYYNGVRMPVKVIASVFEWVSAADINIIIN